MVPAEAVRIGRKHLEASPAYRFNRGPAAVAECRRSDMTDRAAPYPAQPAALMPLARLANFCLWRRRFQRIAHSMGCGLNEHTPSANEDCVEHAPVAHRRKRTMACR